MCSRVCVRVCGVGQGSRKDASMSVSAAPATCERGMSPTCEPDWAYRDGSQTSFASHLLTCVSHASVICVCYLRLSFASIICVYRLHLSLASITYRQEQPVVALVSKKVQW